MPSAKANLELIKKLAKHFKVSSSQIRIVSGLKSKRKIVEKRFLNGSSKFSQIKPLFLFLKKGRKV